jgi:prepilin-type N-terminal cleavage/methylation domain-containing protein
MAAGRRWARGFTLVELVVVVVAIGLLAGVALDRLLPIIGRSQRIAFLQVQAELQSALLLEAADRITRGEAATLAALADSNPMALLLRAPANYVGAQQWPDHDAMPRATWYFEEQRGALIYRVGRYTRFDPLGGPADRVELRVAFVYRDQDGDGAYGVGRDRFGGLRLEPVQPFAWPD